MTNNKVLLIAEIAMMAALGLIFDYLANLFEVAIFPQGGSISLSMIPIFIMAYRRGLVAGLATGFIVGAVQILFASGGYLVHPVQVALDYYGAYTAVGFAGIVTLFKKKTPVMMVIGIIIGGSLRYLSHVIAGIVFWGEWAPEGFNAVTWSLYYNMTYMLPNIIIAAIVVVLMVKKQQQLINAN